MIQLEPLQIQKTSQKFENNVRLFYKNDISLQEDIQPAEFWSLFRFADRNDYILMILGSVCAIGNGIAIPFFAYPYGQMTQAFAPNTSTDFIVDQVKQAYILFLVNSVVVFLLSWIMFSSWMITSERQSIRCRKQYFESLLVQEVAWYDHNKIQQLATNVYTQSSQLQNAIGQKVSKIFMTSSMGIAGFIIAFSRGWKLAIVIMSVIPFLLLAGFFNNHFLKQLTDFMRKITSKAQGMAEQALYSIKTVKVLNGEEYESDNFNAQNLRVTKRAINYGYVRATMASLFFFCIIMTYTIGFWYGSVLVGKRQINSNSGAYYSVSDVVIIFFTIYMSGMNLGQIPECIKNFTVGRKAAAKIYSILDRKPLIENGNQVLECDKLDGKIGIQGINFRDVRFYYEKPLFQQFNLEIKKGKIAFVGESGSGKSTIVGLVLRFYDPESGTISLKLKNRQLNLKEVCLHSLRDKIGYVGQQPVLIGNTIRQAISYTPKPQQQIIKALKQAEAWDFVKNIGLDSEFGSLSGGQKQRIAIARALIKKPQILILDEATSALDRKNQKQIQHTLDKLEVPFMIVIAHKIQTIKTANDIIVLQTGSILERGNYSELMKKKGKFYQLAKDQQNRQQQQELSESRSEITESKKSQIIIASKKQIQGSLNKNAIVPLGAISLKDDNFKEDPKEEQFEWSQFWRLLNYNKQYFWLIVIGLIASMFTGTVFPLFSAFLSKIVVILSSMSYCADDQVPQYQAQADSITKILFIIACLSLLTQFVKTMSFIYIAQKLSFSLKKDVYKKLLYLPYTYHETNKQGSSVLSGDCHAVNSLTSSLLSDILQNSTTLVVGLTIAFVYCWQITLVALAVIPILLLAGKAQMNFNVGFSTETDEAYKKSHQIVLLSILNYKTVLAFNLQKQVTNEYNEHLEEPMKIAIKKGNIAGLLFGLSQMILSCILALIFYIGSVFIRDYHMDVLNIFTAIYAIMFAAVQAGGNLQFVPNIAQLKLAAVNIFKVLDQTDELEMQINRKSKSLMTPVVGKIQIDNISFQYATRDVPVFTNISLNIESGQRVAFVGSSGCGKSTILQLLLRMYQCRQGKILLDGENIVDYDLHYLRSQFGVVSQEPVLFNRTVIENIRYNRDDIPTEEVVRACEQANALGFINQSNFGFQPERLDDASDHDLQEETNSQNGFHRKVGIKGSFLSGGQKQRIAIARAIVRKPKILLLDQATSALDTQNEEQVQAALDNIQGLTTIIVAHRLSTIQRCDKIFVFHQGTIVEEGTYQDLLQLRGFFYRLANGIKQRKTKML